MTVPVLRQLLQQNPGYSNSSDAKIPGSLFETLERTTVYPLKQKENIKVKGMYKLYRELKKQYPFDAVADLHNVLRSKVLAFLFKTAGIKTARLIKAEKKKKQLTRKENKRLVQLKTSFQRYADVFTKLDLPVDIEIRCQPVFAKTTLPPAASFHLLYREKKHLHRSLLQSTRKKCTRLKK